MMRLMIFLLGISLAACGSEPSRVQAASDKPMRIVSLDFCADQYVLKLADADQVLALSPAATSDYSYMRDAATGVPTVRPVAEDVLILKPDLVVRSYGGGPNAASFFERAGVPVLQVGWASNIDGEEMGSIPSLIQNMADGLGQSERGQAVVAQYRERLLAVKARRDGDMALYMTPAGVTTGAGSLVHEMLSTVGLENFQSTPGWRSLPLERLAYEQPDVVVAAYYATRTNHPNAWSASNHPVARAQLDGSDVVQLRGAWIACGSWFLMDAIEALAEGPTE